MVPSSTKASSILTFPCGATLSRPSKYKSHWFHIERKRYTTWGQGAGMDELLVWQPTRAAVCYGSNDSLVIDITWLPEVGRVGRSQGLRVWWLVLQSGLECWLARRFGLGQRKYARFSLKQSRLQTLQSHMPFRKLNVKPNWAFKYVSWLLNVTNVYSECAIVG